MVVDYPEGGKAKYTVEEVTEAEMKDQEEHWILSHCELLVEFSFDSERKVVKVEKCTDGHYVKNSSNNPYDTNN